MRRCSALFVIGLFSLAIASSAANADIFSAVAASSGTSDLNAFNSANEVSTTVGAGESFGGIGSYTTAGGTVLGTTMTILGGTNTSGSTQTITMNWRDRAAIETWPTYTSAPIHTDEYGLVADVAQVTGLNGMVFAMQMTYDDSGFVLENGHDELWYAQNQWVYLGWLNPTIGYWENAVNGNTGSGNDPQFMGVGAWNGDLTLGHWGVDTDLNHVWAVLDHNSQFSAMPEPTTVALLTVGLLALRRRRNT